MLVSRCCGQERLPGLRGLVRRPAVGVAYSRRAPCWTGGWIAGLSVSTVVTSRVMDDTASHLYGGVNHGN
jgi:hypothetical protein